MKQTNILLLGVLAAAGLAFLAPAAHATGQVTYSSGDILLGFEEPGNGNDYIVDLGPASYFITLSQTPGTTDITTAAYSGAGLGNIDADLLSTSGSGGFGASWYANSNTAGSNVQWGVFGDTKGFGGNFGLPGNTLFETVAEQTPGGGSTAPAESSPSSQGSIASEFNSFASGFNNADATTNSTHATFQLTTGLTSWTANDPSLAAFGGPIGIEQPQSGSNIGPTNSQLDLYELIPTGDAGSTGKGGELGDFTLTSTGQLEFTSAAVPEPSTYAMVGLGAILLVFFRRNRKSTLS